MMTAAFPSIILTALSRPAEERDRQQARQFISGFQAGIAKLGENLIRYSKRGRATARQFLFRASFCIGGEPCSIRFNHFRERGVIF